MSSAVLASHRAIGRPGGQLLVAFGASAAAVVSAVALWITVFAPSSIGSEPKARVVLADAPPVPELMAFRPVAPTDALTINAAVPFSTAPNPPAKPMALTLPAPDLARAVDCLAAAAFYEAGDDAEGQASVAQVVLNRLRHPAFPKTVCGVVFQGSERRTGCQFTFTCDGALARTPSLQAWERARQVARDALSGTIFAAVGHATHYHTDWVVPYWSASLDKIAAVKTHLFFRWKGDWGKPAVFVDAHGGQEPAIAKIAHLSAAHQATNGGTPQTGDQAEVTPGLQEVRPVEPARPPVLLSEAEGFVLFLDPSTTASDLPMLAATVCGARDFCKVRGWLNHASVPARLPIDALALTSMSFSYVRNRSQRFERAQWNCGQFPREKAKECLKIPFARSSPIVAKGATAIIDHGVADIGQATDSGRRI